MNKKNPSVGGKKKIIEEFKKKDKDTGSAEVQIGILTREI